jgi:azurin
MFMKFTLSLLSTIALASIPLALADEKKAEESPKPAVTDAGTDAKAPADTEKFDVEVVISGNDQMQFDKKAFTVTAGEKVKLTFKNIGNLPKVAMGHNLVILNKGANKVEFATAAIPAGPTSEYIPAAKKKEILANTKLLGPKESDSIIFTAPEPGKYDYLCTFPGHFALMNGAMTVK